MSVAIDVDNNGLYFAVDGEWAFSTVPGVDAALLPLGNNGQPAFPCQNLSEGDEYRANFGQEPFVADIPEGYNTGLF